MSNFKIRAQQVADKFWERVLLEPKVWAAFFNVLIIFAKEYGWDISSEAFIALQALVLAIIVVI